MCDRQQHFCDAVRIGFDLAGGGDFVGRQIPQLHHIPFDLIEHRRRRR
jgi:hypothetical protein